MILLTFYSNKSEAGYPKDFYISLLQLATTPILPTFPLIVIIIVSYDSVIFDSYPPPYLL